MKIFIVCSKHHYAKVKPIASLLERAGHVITLPNSFDDPFKEEKMKRLSRQEHIAWKRMMLRRDEDNIRPQDALLVLNFEKNGIPNYIGGATFLEVFKAFELEKKIFFFNPLPSCSFTDELKAFDPVIINGDLGVIL